MLGWVSYDFSLYCSSITSGSYDKGRAWCVSKFLIQCFQFAYIEACIPVQLYICTLGPTATWVHTGFLILKCLKVNAVEVIWHWWNENYVMKHKCPTFLNMHSQENQWNYQFFYPLELFTTQNERPCSTYPVVTACEIDLFGSASKQIYFIYCTC